MSMANTVKLKQSAVAGKVPATTDLELGELAVNTYDGKLFLKKKVGTTETVVDLTASAAGVASFSGGTTGLTPAAASTGAVTLGGTLAVGNGGTGGATNTDARANLNTPSRSGLSTANGGDASIFAEDRRAVANPMTGLGYIYGVRFRFGSNNENASSPNFWCDTIDLSTYVDASGGGVNSLQFRKDTNEIWHKYAGAGATSWTTNKRLRYCDPGKTWQDVTSSRVAGTTYTNSSGGERKILIRVRGAGGVNSSSANFTISGVGVGTYTLAESNSASWNQVSQTISVTVPAGGTYALTLNNAVRDGWLELDC